MPQMTLFHVFGLALACQLSAAMAPGDSFANAAQPAQAVAATVNDVPVLVDQVDREVRLVLRGRQAGRELKSFLRAQALQLLIDRQRILLWLSSRQLAATDQDVQHAVGQLSKRLAAREIGLTEFLKQQQMTEADLHQTLRWQLSWQRFLDRYLTAGNLQVYFNDHRRQFDGTQLRVAHVLLKVEPVDNEDRRAAQLRAASRLREEITAGSTTFAEAARQFSDAPTAVAGGDIGFISRDAPMPESFSKAAFDLEVGEVSLPVVSPFGVHLIQCLEVKPGQKTWQQVRDRLESAVTQYLFRWAAEKAEDATVTFTGAVPHFKPGTKEMQSPGK